MRAKSFYEVCRFAGTREFEACWLGSRLWQELGLDEFFSAVLHDRRGSVEWAKVIELLAVNRLVTPESELAFTSAGTRRPPWMWCWEPMML